MIIWQLFITFFVIGLFNFGGGGAMISLIQNQVVDVRGWISESSFTDIIAISQTTPGPIGINCATYVGYEVAGVAGSLVATVSVVIPSFLVFLALVKIFDRFNRNRYFLGVMGALKPVVSGLIFAAAFILIFRVSGMHLSLIEENFPDWKSWLFFLAALILSLSKKVSPIKIIIAAGLLGLLFC